MSTNTNKSMLSGIYQMGKTIRDNVSFSGLNDTPSGYLGHSGDYLVVNDGESGIHFTGIEKIAADLTDYGFGGNNSENITGFTGLHDTPTGYQSGYYLRSTETGIEYIDATGLAADIGDEIVNTIVTGQLLAFTGLKDTPVDYKNLNLLQSSNSDIGYISPEDLASQLPVIPNRYNSPEDLPSPAIAYDGEVVKAGCDLYLSCDGAWVPISSNNTANSVPEGYPDCVSNTEEIILYDKYQDKIIEENMANALLESFNGNDPEFNFNSVCLFTQNNYNVISFDPADEWTEKGTVYNDLSLEIEETKSDGTTAIYTRNNFTARRQEATVYTYKWDGSVTSSVNNYSSKLFMCDDLTSFKFNDDTEILQMKFVNAYNREINSNKRQANPVIVRSKINYNNGETELISATVRPWDEILEGMYATIDWKYLIFNAKGLTSATAADGNTTNLRFAPFRYVLEYDETTKQYIQKGSDLPFRFNSDDYYSGECSIFKYELRPSANQIRQHYFQHQVHIQHITRDGNRVFHSGVCYRKRSYGHENYGHWIYVYDFIDGDWEFTYKFTLPSNLRSYMGNLYGAISPDGNYVAFGVQDPNMYGNLTTGNFYIYQFNWSTASVNLVLELPYWALKVQYSQNGNVIVFTSRRGYIHRLELVNGEWQHYMQSALAAPFYMTRDASFVTVGQSQSLYWDPSTKQWNEYGISNLASTSTSPHPINSAGTLKIIDPLTSNMDNYKFYYLSVDSVAVGSQSFKNSVVIEESSYKWGIFNGDTTINISAETDPNCTFNYWTGAGVIITDPRNVNTTANIQGNTSITGVFNCG